MKLEGKSLRGHFIRFMIPSVLAQWVFSLYSMVDGLFVARGVSETALAAVNIAMPFTNFLFSVSLMFAVGSSTVIAIKLGQKRLEEANRVCTQNIVLMVVLSIIIAAGVLLNLDTICRFLGATDLTIGYVKEYITTIAIFNGCFMVAYSFEILVKTDGFPQYAIMAIVLSGVMNIILDYLFVMRMGYGVAGAGFATGLSQAFLVVLYTAHFLGKHATLRFCRFKVDARMIWRTVKIGVPSGLTELSAGIIVFLFNHAILRYIGEEAIVSYTVVAYLNTIVVMAMAGVAQGFQPLVSYHYGKGNMDSCKKLLRYGLNAAAIISIAAFVFCMIFAEQVVSLFIVPELVELRSYSTLVFRIFSVSFLLLGYNVVIGGYFTAIERPKSALAISLSRGFVALVISLAVLIPLMGGDGIWWAATLSEVVCLVLSVGLYRVYKRHKERRREAALASAAAQNQ